MKSIVIHDWMLRDPRLSGIKLLIYAVVFSFINLDHPCFLSIDSWLALLHCSRSQFFKVKKELIDDRILFVDDKGCFISICTIYEPAYVSSEIKCQKAPDWDELYRIAKTPWVYDE